MNRYEDLPAFDELPIAEPLGLRHAWDALPHNLGTLARQSPERVVEAARLVRSGTVVSLNLPVTEPDPPLYGRQPLRHEIFALNRNEMDDRLDGFYLQGSSQWDGLRHVRARELGYFGGCVEDPTPGPGARGMEHFAEHGIVGRGVLLDVQRHLSAGGTPLDPFAGEAIAPETLCATAEAQGVELRKGDVLCVRTGWVQEYRKLPRDRREQMGASPRTSGLTGSEAMARFLWDAGASAVALDNPSAEVAPGDPAVGSLHRRLIPMLGFVVGELLDFGPLSELCARDGVWDFLFVAVPINLPGGVGSPANAVAIR
jgi:kynurenine formamidase